jgi:hypothetical protein
MHVEGLAVPQVQRDQDLVGEGGIGGHDVGAHALERRVVAHVAAREVHAVGVPVLVAVGVLEVDDRLVVLSPEEAADPALLVGGHHLVVRAPDRLDPDLEDVLRVRGDPGQPFPVGRDLGRHLLRVAEQDLARDERRRVRA